MCYCHIDGRTLRLYTLLCVHDPCLIAVKKNLQVQKSQAISKYMPIYHLQSNMCSVHSSIQIKNCIGDHKLTNIRKKVKRKERMSKSKTTNLHKQQRKYNIHSTVLIETGFCSTIFSEQFLFLYANKAQQQVSFMCSFQSSIAILAMNKQ